MIRRGLWTTILAGGGITLSAAALGQSAGNNLNEGSYQRATISSELEANDNYDLRNNPQGDALLWTNTVLLEQMTRTRTDRLYTSASGDLRFSDLPVVGTDTALDNGTLSLDWNRNVDDNRVSASAYINDADITFFDPLRALRDDGSFDDTRGDGRRTTMTGRFGLGLNENGPISFEFSGAARSVDYRETTDSSLRDYVSLNTSGEFGFQVTDTLTTILGARYEVFEQENDGTDRRDWDVYTGISGPVSRVSQIALRFGYGEAHTERRNEDPKDEAGAVGSLRWTVDRPNGEYEFDARTRITENGRRNEIIASRSMELPGGSIAGAVGLSNRDDLDPRPLVRLSYGLERPTESLLFSISQSVNTNDDGDDVFNASLSARYNRQINRVSSFSINALAARREQLESNPVDNNVTRLTLVAEYRHSLTADWSLAGGYRHRSRLTNDDDDARSNSVFLRLDRRFSARR